MNKNIKNIVGVVVVTLLIMVNVFLLYIDNKNVNTKKVKEVSSLIEQQEKLQNKFKIDGYTFENPNVILNPYGTSPLTALVLFKTEKMEEVKVTIEGKDENTTFTHSFSKAKEHYLPIYGLYADTQNKVIIEIGEEKKELTIKTDKLPDNMVLPESVNAVKDKLGNELYFYTPSSVGYTCAYDVNGDVRWYLTNYALWKIDKLKNGHLLVSTERLINSPYYMTGLYEMDLLGKIYYEYSLEGGYHHDYYEMENGNLLISSDNFNSGDGTVEDYIVEMDRKTGKIVKKYDLKDILNEKDGQSENWSSYDWFHNNSVWYDKKTNSITLSGRHMDAVINIDYKTGKLNWIIGDSTNWSKEYQKYFFKPVGDNFEWQWSQHAAMITPEGYVFLFDNGNNKSKKKEEYVDASDSYSRGVMYKINTKEMTIEQIFEYGKERGSEFYSPYISDVDYLDKDHYIILSGGIVYKDGKNSNQPAGLGGYDKLVSDTVELKDGEVIFEMKLPTNTYRVEKMSLYNDDENFELSNSKRLGSLGKTKSKSSKITFSLKDNKIDKEYKSHDINITKEIDRLVVKGRFKKGTNVNIILYKNLKTKIYNFPVSKKPYTALCVDILTDLETEKGISITKYINSDGLNGKYSIYIEIDGKLYNTEEYVEF